jgi:hypothetical protein
MNPVRFHLVDRPVSPFSACTLAECGVARLFSSGLDRERVDDVTGGIQLYPSPPPVKKTNVVVKLAAPEMVPPASVDQISLAGDTMLRVHEVAPGWEHYYLKTLWREWIATKAGMPTPMTVKVIGAVRSKDPPPFRAQRSTPPLAALTARAASRGIWRP